MIGEDLLNEGLDIIEQAFARLTPRTRPAHLDRSPAGSAIPPVRWSGGGVGRVKNVCGAMAGCRFRLSGPPPDVRFLQMRETPRPQETVGDTRPVAPQHRPGQCPRARHLGASGSGTPHRSDGRPSQTPRGVRRRRSPWPPRNSPPVPGRPTLFLLLLLPSGPPLRADHLAGRRRRPPPPRGRTPQRLPSRSTRPAPPSSSPTSAASPSPSRPAPSLLVYVALARRSSGTDRWWRARSTARPC